MVSVCLGVSLYLWNASTSDISEMLNTANMEGLSGDVYPSSIKWIENGNCLAVGLSNGTIQLWDAVKQAQVREMKAHEARVTSMSWNKFILSSGGRDSKIMNLDVRKPNAMICGLQEHTQEVCGLKWSPDGKQLASGGNDNLVCVWDIG